MSKTIVSTARAGSISEEMRKLSELEGVPAEKIRDRIASGRIVIIANNRLENLKVTGVGRGLYTKVNVNVGTSGTVMDVEMEREKVKIAVEYGADTVMDLSIGGDLDEIRRLIIREARPLPVGTVPVYQAWIEGVRRYGGAGFPSDWFLEIVERHLRDGVAFMTIHSAISLELARRAVRSSRIMPIVSRGGAMLAAWMLENNEENPFRRHWDYLAELFAEYDAVVSIGDALRPGSIVDQHDELQIAELTEAARQVKSLREKGVQVIVEGPGHMTIDQVASNIKLMKKLTDGAPYYVLGPLVTDIAMGYDHIAAAIGGAIAAASGADFLCYLTPAEHLSLPTPEQVKEGLIAARIAAHAGDIVKLGARAYRRDFELSLHRARLEWSEVFKYAFDRERALRIYKQFNVNVSSCNMCGQYCVFLLLGKYLRERAVGGSLSQ
ncbi:MAG: phosphomethylpyrimidine synthase ThiC [Desulfurococcus sp.]|nr:phosphomethylpyrimidine synthase ThiC [Desulfurococcus sp.]